MCTEVIVPQVPTSQAFLSLIVQNSTEDVVDDLNLFQHISVFSMFLKWVSITSPEVTLYD